MSKTILYIVVLMTITVIIFTVPSILIQPSCSKRFDYSSSSSANIGTLIGGIAGPIIGMINAFLLYITFKEQKEINNSLISEKRIQEIEQKIEKLHELSSLNKNILQLLLIEIHSQQESNQGINDETLNKVRYIISLFNQVLKDIESVNLYKSQTTTIFVNLYLGLFSSDFGKIKSSIESLSSPNFKSANHEIEELGKNMENLNRLNLDFTYFTYDINSFKNQS